MQKSALNVAFISLVTSIVNLLTHRVYYCSFTCRCIKVSRSACIILAPKPSSPAPSAASPSSLPPRPRALASGHLRREPSSISLSSLHSSLPASSCCRRRNASFVDVSAHGCRLSLAEPIARIARVCARQQQAGARGAMDARTRGHVRQWRSWRGGQGTPARLREVMGGAASCGRSRERGRMQQRWQQEAVPAKVAASNIGWSWACGDCSSACAGARQ